MAQVSHFAPLLVDVATLFSHLTFWIMELCATILAKYMLQWPVLQILFKSFFNCWELFNVRSQRTINIDSTFWTLLSPLLSWSDCSYFSIFYSYQLLIFLIKFISPTFFLNILLFLLFLQLPGMLSSLCIPSSSLFYQAHSPLSSSLCSQVLQLYWMLPVVDFVACDVFAFSPNILFSTQL